MFSPRIFLKQPFTYPGLVILELQAVTSAADDGTSGLMAPNVCLLYLLTGLCTWKREALIMFSVSVISRDTVMTYPKERCAWDSGSEIATDMGMLMGTQDGIQYPGSLLKKFLKHKLKRDSKD